MSFVRICAIALVGLLLVPELAPGQPTRIPPFTGANYINDVILGDTLANGERRDPNAIYELQSGGISIHSICPTWTFVMVQIMSAMSWVSPTL